MRPSVPLLAIALSLSGPAAGETPPEESDLLCIDPPFTGESAVAPRLSAVLSDIRRSLGPFPGLLETLDTAEIPICLETRTTDARGYLDVERNVIAVSDRLSPAQQWVIIVHELRHLDQFTRGYCPSNELAMAENARAVFAMEADAQAIAALVAWSARESGEEAPWEALTGWPEYRDIAERFEAEMRSSGDAGLAVAAAFDQWYASETRVTHYYYASCSDYLDRQDRDNLLPSYGLLDLTFYEALCVLPDGTRYACAPPEDGR